MARLLAVLLFLFQTHLTAASEDLIKLAAEGKYLDREYLLTVASLKSDELNQARDADGRTMLHWMAARSHQARALVLLLAGADVHAGDQRGRTPIFYTIEAQDPVWKGDADFMILEMLVLCGADVNARAHDGTTPLAFAAEKGDYRKAEFLIWRGAALTPAGVPPEKTPLSIAYAKRDQRMIDLLKAAAKIEGTNPAASKPGASKSSGHRLSDALTSADLNAIEDLLAGGWDIDQQDENSHTALFRAVDSARADLASLLLFEGADPNIPTKTGKTPLIASVRFLGIDGQRMTGMLLLKGANVNAAMKSGETALIAAVSSGHDYGVLPLIAAGADPNAPTPKGSLMSYATHPPTAALLKGFGVPAKTEAPETNRVAIMFEAAKVGDVAGVERELIGGVAADAEFDVERTALVWAAPYGHFEVVDLLLRHGANINKQYRTTGRHVLHGLAGWGGTAGDSKLAAEHILKLLERGANPNIAMKDGTTPLMIAAKEGVTGANTEALLKGGALINARDKSGLTALGIARKHGRSEMVEFLKQRGGLD